MTRREQIRARQEASTATFCDLAYLLDEVTRLRTALETVMSTYENREMSNEAVLTMIAKLVAEALKENPNG